jgi:chaperonin GroEL
MDVNIKDKEIINKEKFRDLVLRAVNVLAEPVVATLGPEGLPILIQREGVEPLSTKDGVTVARHVKVKDNRLDTIITALKQTAEKTNEEAGDGTTTAIALVRAIIREGIKYIKADAITPQELVYEIKGLMGSFDFLSVWKKDITTKEEQFDVAHISSNNDKEVAQKIVEALEMAGEDGYISVEEGTVRETQVKFVEGYTLPSGWNRLGAYGMTFINNSSKNSVDMHEPAILLYDGPISDMNDLANFYIVLTNNGKKNIPVLILAHSFEGDALNLLIQNKRVGYTIGLIPVPQFSGGASKRIYLEDLAVFTGGKVVNHDSNGITKAAIKEVEKAQYLIDGVLGSCKKVIIGKQDSFFCGGLGDEEEKIKHSKTLKEQLSLAESDFDRDLVKLRVSKMVGGIFQLLVGGGSELEIKEKKYRVEDALNATRAAIELGVVPGGGIVLFNLAEMIITQHEEMIGAKVLKEALKEPLRQILINAGIQPDVIISDLKKTVKDNPFRGYDAKKKVMVEDMIAAGIIDPLKVTTMALKSAVSIACELLCGGGMLVFETDKNNPFSKLSAQDLRPDLFVNEANQEM